jgi:signal transduction histidine kinase
VVQDLAGASFAVSALARAPEVPADARIGLEDAGRSLRRSLRGLRSLMVEIYPPDLHSEGLQAALDDLLAPVSTRGVQATAVVTGADAAPEAVVGLVWRVAQEAVRNALRHSGARSLTVRVSGEPDGGDHSEGTSPPGAGVLVLEVTDDGCGFDPDAQQASGHFGLRGMSSLIAEAGGRLAVRSSPGHGTTIRLEVPGAAT